MMKILSLISLLIVSCSTQFVEESPTTDAGQAQSTRSMSNCGVPVKGHEQSSGIESAGPVDRELQIVKILANEFPNGATFNIAGTFLNANGYFTSWMVEAPKEGEYIWVVSLDEVAYFSRATPDLEEVVDWPNMLIEIQAEMSKK